MNIEDYDKPTKNQLEFAKRLGIEIHNDITKWELSDLIDDAVKRKKEQNHIQTIEKTGKFYKGMMLTGIAIMAIGIFVAFRTLDYDRGIFWAIIGFIIFIVGKIFAWWHHG